MKKLTDRKIIQLNLHINFCQNSNDAYLRRLGIEFSGKETPVLLIDDFPNLFRNNNSNLINPKSI